MRAALLALLVACLAAAAQDNLLPNPGFEADADGDGFVDGWDREIQQQNRGAFARDTDVQSAGAASLRLDHPDDNNVWVRSSVVDLPARPTSAYRLDARVRATGAWSILLYEFSPALPAPGYLTHTLVSGGDTAGAWRDVGGGIVTGDQAVSFKVSLIANGQGIVWFDDVSLIRVGARPEASIQWTETAPSIDGRLDEACWRGAEVIGPLFVMGSAGERPAAATRARLLWNADAIYLGVVCDEPNPAGLRRTVTTYDGPVYTDDSVEIFFDPAARGVGYAQLAVNAAGARFDTRQLDGLINANWYDTRGTAQVDWDPAWTAEVTVGADSWTVEIALPLAAFDRPPGVGDTWGANLCRERYVVEELSTWSPLPGDTFLDPANFGSLTFRGPAAAPRVVDRGPADIPARAHLVPVPQQMQMLPGTLELPAPLVIAPAGEESRRYAEACAALFGAARVGEAQPGAVEVMTVAELAGRPAHPPGPLPARPEEYDLHVDEARVQIVGADAMGVRNGLMSLLQLARFQNGGYWLPMGTVHDYPSLPFRAWHLVLPTRADDAAMRTWLSTAAKLKYNAVMIEVNEKFAYERHPELAAADAPTKQQYREWVAYARSLGLEVIPQVQVYGHFNWVLNHPNWQSMAEDPTAEGRWGRWNANIRDPRYYPLVFDLFEEVVEVFAPTRFHIGHDEITFQPIGVHPDTRDTPPHQLLVEEVTRLHAWLRERNLQVLMWADQLLPDQHGGPPHHTAQAIDLLPKDIVLVDWHYAPRETYPSVRFLREHGYPVIACGWWDPLNLWWFCDTAADDQALGFAGSSWYQLSRFSQSAEHQTGFVLAAENAWSNRVPAIDELPYEPLRVWRDLAAGRELPAETRYAPLDLRRWANAPLGDRSAGWLGAGPGRDLGELPRGLHWWWGVPYDILDGGLEAVVTADLDDPPGALPTAVRGIPVGTAAKALYFAWTTAAPSLRTNDIYERDSQLPRQIGLVVVHYADGAEERVPIVYRRNITDWNDGLPPGTAPTVWTGHTADGSWAQLPAWRWDNPRPDQPIASLDLRAVDSPLRIGLIAVTAAVE